MYRTRVPWRVCVYMPLLRTPLSAVTKHARGLMSLGMSHLLPTSLWPGLWLESSPALAEEGEEERLGRARKRLVVLTALAYAAWFVYTRNAKHSLPVWGHRWAGRLACARYF